VLNVCCLILSLFQLSMQKHSAATLPVLNNNRCTALCGPPLLCSKQTVQTNIPNSEQHHRA
jgi:hypothetical protein